MKKSCFSSKATGPVVLKYVVEPPGAEGTNIFLLKWPGPHDQHDRHAHIKKHFTVKTLKNLFLRN